MRMVLCGRYIKWGYNRAASRRVAASCGNTYTIVLVLAKAMETTHFPYYTIVKKYVVAKMEAGWSHKKRPKTHHDPFLVL